MNEEPILKPCVVCGRKVVVASDFEGDVLCINDFFTDDPTEDWEADE
jgi:hypothetical protein